MANIDKNKGKWEKGDVKVVKLVYKGRVVTKEQLAKLEAEDERKRKEKEKK